MYPMYHNDFRNKILAGVMALALLSMAAGGLLLWKNRRGTPGEPVGLYHRLLCDGLALERQYIRQDAKDYPRQVLVVDLSGEDGGVGTHRGRLAHAGGGGLPGRKQRPDLPRAV